MKKMRTLLFILCMLFAILTAYSGKALSSEGTVWAWGSNWYGQLGDGSQASLDSYKVNPVQTIGLGNMVSVGGGWFIHLP